MSLVAAALAAIVSTAPATEPPTAPTKASSMFREGEAHLRELDRRIAGDSSNATLRRDRLRTLYFLSVADGKWLSPASRELGRLAREGSVGTDLRDAYLGAFDVVRAKHALWPPSKLDFLKAAEPRLDSAAKRSPDDIEVRYLRLMSCYYLPFFFGRSWSVREDFDALARLLPASLDAVPPGLHARIVEFVLHKHKTLGAADRIRLETSLRISRGRAQRSPGT